MKTRIQIPRYSSWTLLLTLLSAGSLSAQAPADQVQPLSQTGSWVLDQEVIYNPSMIRYVRGYVVLTDDNPDRQVVLFREGDMQYLGGFGRIGRGPAEYLSPWLILGNPITAIFCIYDLNLRRISCYDADQVSSDFSRVEPTLTVSLDGSFGIPLNLEARLPQKEFIVTGIFTDETRYMVSDSTGRVTQQSGVIPGIMPRAPINVQQNAALARVATHPLDGRLAFAYRFTDRIGIYSAEGKLIHEIAHPDKSSDPGLVLAYTPSGQPYMAQDNNTRLAYVHVLADDRYIYGLYSGRQRRQGAADFASYLYVFDWKGNRVASHSLNTFVGNCTLTGRAGTMLCLERTEDYRDDFRILKFEIPDPRSG